MNTERSSKAYYNNKVGPVLRAGELAEVVIEAAKIDNPGKEIFVDDKLAYIRIHADREMILRQETIERQLGRPFKIKDLEIDLCSFAGQIETMDKVVRFYFEKEIV